MPRYKPVERNGLFIAVMLDEQIHGLADGCSVGPLQGAPSQRLGPSPGTNSPQDCLCPGSASFLPRTPLMRYGATNLGAIRRTVWPRAANSRAQWCAPVHACIATVHGGSEAMS